MAESERTRVRERGPIDKADYEQALEKTQEFSRRQRTGQIVIKRSDRPTQVTRQGRLLYYLLPGVYKEVPLQDWAVFINDVRTHSGKHRHQGGLVIYVLEGKGYSIVDEERVDWEKGDLLLLPIRPGGVEHQHFNSEPGKGCQWVAFLHWPTMEHLAMELTQVEESPDFKALQK